MPQVVTKCSVCQALLDEEDLFCANCGTEAPSREQTRHDQSRTATRSFQCSGCGASMSYSAEMSALVCPFCGSEDLLRKESHKTLAPDAVVPFEIAQGQAEANMRAWLGQGFWRPGDLAKTASVVAMRPVYVPYWVFSATTHTYWTADTSETPAGARGDWRPLAGEHHGRHEGLLVGASGALSPAETAAICPFDLSRAEPPENVDLDHSTIEEFAVPRKLARPLAHAGLENLERAACDEVYVPGNCRNLHVNVRIEGLSSVPMLLPVWIMAYRYGETVFRFLVNGQTGKATGTAPTSWRKIAAAIGIGLLVVLLILAIVAFSS